MVRYRIRNWSRYQHYKDRNPPWIKLHVEILQSEDWVLLDDASKLLAVVCMVVAAKDNGEFNGNPAYLKRVAYLDKTPNLNPLIECGFLEKVLADDSACEQEQANVRPEKETYRTEIDSEPNGSAAVAANPPDIRKSIFDEWLPWLARHSGKSQPHLRGLVAKWCHAHGDGAVLAAFSKCARSPPAEPVSFIETILNGRSHGNRPDNGYTAAFADAAGAR